MTTTSTGTVSNKYITSGTTSTGTTVTTSQYYYVPTPYTISTSDLCNIDLTQTDEISKKIINKICNVTVSTKDNNEFKDVIEYKKNKVYGFEFYDGTKVKTVLEEGDTFSLEYAFYLALAKKLFSKTHTFYGVLCKTADIQLEKYYINLVKKGMKLFKKKQEEQEKKELEELEKEEQHKRYIEKKKKRDKKLQERYDEEFINLIAKAIKKGKEEG